jgi:hypothetical protein
MLKRTVYKLCSKNGIDVKGYARVRDEGFGNVTMTTKTYTDPKFPEENEISIKDDYDTACKFMSSLGIIEKAKQESYREKWSHSLAHEITFDTLPGLPTYMEVDCTSEDNLVKLIDILNLNKDKMRFGAFDATYEEYYGIEKSIINDYTPSLTFSNILNEIKPIKNKDLLEKIAKGSKSRTKSKSK